jgi:hypothetical protein
MPTKLSIEFDFFFSSSFEKNCYPLFVLSFFWANVEMQPLLNGSKRSKESFEERKLLAISIYNGAGLLAFVDEFKIIKVKYLYTHHVV